MRPETPNGGISRKYRELSQLISNQNDVNPNLSYRIRFRTLLGVRDGLGRGGAVLLDVDGASDYLHQLERWRAQQFQVGSYLNSKILEGKIEIICTTY